ncbi:MAG: hypothetical protein HY293_17515, partial [Planctomycetes bacterium]|nr:hypothetical protein [Planctomycetota bacterium]
MPESGVRFGPAFACCPTARTLLVACGLTLFGTGSIIALEAGVTEHIPTINPRMAEWITIVCIATYVLALLLGLVGTVSIFIHGLNRSGEITIRGSRYRGMTLSKAALSIFTLPWILLAVMIVSG